MRKYQKLMLLFAVLALITAACASDDAETTTTAAAETTTTAAAETTTTAAAETTTTAAPIAYKACEVTDTGGVDDRSFNQSAWEGALRAEAELGVAVKVLESQSAADFEPNINSLVGEDCNLVITVGFLLGDATLAAAQANPDVSFSILDYAYDPAVDNIAAHVYATAEGGFLAGYAAAGMTQTGTIATYGGIDIGGPVTDFMDGFVWGARYYNQQKGADVQVLGWNPDTKEGLFTGNFESIEDARTLSVSLADEGADIFLPVGGQIGQGSAALAQERGNMWVIGVDSDWFLSVPAYADVILTSVLKKIDVSVFDTIKAGVDGTFAGGTVVNTMASGGIDIAPFHDADPLVPAELKAELDEIKAAIIDGSLDIVISG
ncbi:MAG: BMP family ABC transporter substrate-binding protein [Acidimicrobiia bacterium]|nr:BMP family ABC transporter substrate-binding protein [Acidimicrobiia bacterium]